LYIAGFGPTTRAYIQHRLSISEINHRWDEPYLMEKVHAAAEFLLGGTYSLIPHQPAQYTVPPSYHMLTTPPGYPQMPSFATGHLLPPPSFASGHLPPPPILAPGHLPPPPSLATGHLPPPPGLAGLPPLGPQPSYLGPQFPAPPVGYQTGLPTTAAAPYLFPALPPPHPSYAPAPVPTATPAVPPPIKREPSDNATLTGILTALSALSQSIANQPPPPPHTSGPRSGGCTMCSDPGHVIRDCPQVEAYIRAGMCVRNPEGRVVLSNGRYVPATVTGRNLAERIDRYLARYPIPAPISTVSTFTDSVPAPIIAPPLSPPLPTPCSVAAAIPARPALVSILASPPPLPPSPSPPRSVAAVAPARPVPRPSAPVQLVTPEPSPASRFRDTPITVMRHELRTAAPDIRRSLRDLLTRRQVPTRTVDVFHHCITDPTPNRHLATASVPTPHTAGSPPDPFADRRPPPARPPDFAPQLPHAAATHVPQSGLAPASVYLRSAFVPPPVGLRSGFLRPTVPVKPPDCVPDHLMPLPPTSFGPALLRPASLSLRSRHRTAAPTPQATQVKFRSTSAGDGRYLIPRCCRIAAQATHGIHYRQAFGLYLTEYIAQPPASRRRHSEPRAAVAYPSEDRQSRPTRSRRSRNSHRRRTCPGNDTRPPPPLRYHRHTAATTPEHLGLRPYRPPTGKSPPTLTPTHRSPTGPPVRTSGHAFTPWQLPDHCRTLTARLRHDSERLGPHRPAL
jgi:hypothetical protein